MSQNMEQPIPQGKDLPAVRHADLIYTSGMTSRKAGILIYSGKIRASDPLESHRDAVHLATLNALAAAQACLKEGEKISVILQLNIFLNADPEFTEHPKINEIPTHFPILSKKWIKTAISASPFNRSA